MENKVLVETSARHVHVSEATLKVLFGENAELTVKKILSLFLALVITLSCCAFAIPAGAASFETENGVTYVNLPTYGIVNRYGIPWNGMGFQMEVYEDEVIFRARKFNTSRWYGFYEFAIDLV